MGRNPKAWLALAALLALLFALRVALQRGRDPARDATPPVESAAVPPAVAASPLADAVPVEPAADASSARADERAALAAQAAPSDAVDPEPDDDLVVIVRDAAGGPVAAAIVRLVCQRLSATQMEGRMTEADGTARYEQLGSRMATSEAAAWSVQVRLPFLEGLVRTLDPAVIPREPLVFVLPPHGAVVVEVREADGRPVADGTGVALAVIPEGEPRELAPIDHDRRSGQLAPTKNGLARFAHVAPGTELQVSVERPGASAPAVAYGSGPLHAGEEARLVVLLGADEAVVLLRLIDPGGRPLADTEVDLQFNRTTVARHMASRSMSRTTDSDGRLRFELPTAHFEGDTRALHVSTLWDLWAEVDLSRSYPPGETDLGDLVLAPPSLVVAGRVVDTAGRPVMRVQVSVEDVDREKRGWLLEPRTDREGRFDLRVAWNVNEVSVRAGEGARSSPPLRVAAGTTDLVLVVPMVGALAGSVLVDEPLRSAFANRTLRDELDIEVLTSGTTEPRSEARLEEDRTFEVQELLPGLYSVSFTARPGLELARVEGVEVVADETTRDPRLQEVDLRGRLFLHRLLLESPEKTLEVGGWVRHGPPGSKIAEEAAKTRFQGTTVELVSGLSSIDVLLAAEGFRRELLEGIRGEHRVTLRRGFPVRLVLSADTDLPAPPYYLKAALAPLGEAPETLDRDVPNFDARRTVLVTAPASGTLVVRWILERSTHDLGTAKVLALAEEQLVELADTPAEQVVEVRFAPEELARILARPPF